MADGTIARLLHDARGTTAVEYSFITGLVSIATAAVWNKLGLQLVILSAQIVTHLGFSGVITAG